MSEALLKFVPVDSRAEPLELVRSNPERNIASIDLRKQVEVLGLCYKLACKCLGRRRNAPLVSEKRLKVPLSS